MRRLIEVARYLSNGQALWLRRARATTPRDAQFRAGRARRHCHFARRCGCAGWRSGAAGDRVRLSPRARGARRAASRCRRTRSGARVGRPRVGNAGAAARVERRRLSGRGVAGQVMARFVRPVDEVRAGRRLTCAQPRVALGHVRVERLVHVLVVAIIRRQNVQLCVAL